MAKTVVFGIFVVLIMITAVSLTGCMGASTAPATSVAGVAISGANTATDEYPYLKVGVPSFVGSKCLVKNPDNTIRECKGIKGETTQAMYNPQFP